MTVQSEPSPAGRAIEEKSRSIIDERLRPLGLDPFHHAILRRVIHATADFSFIETLRVHPAARERGLAALQSGRPVVCDVRMLAAGITRYAGGAVTAIDDAAVKERARVEGVTRAAAAMRSLAPRLDGAVAAIGNAPTALEAVLDLAGQGFRPALVVGAPVGFVGAAESKEALIASELCYITCLGPRGGSPVAAAMVNALLEFM